MKQLKHASKTLAKTHENHVKHMQHPNKHTIATYA
jgi:hypothetical protein